MRASIEIEHVEYGLEQLKIIHRSLAGNIFGTDEQAEHYFCKLIKQFEEAIGDEVKKNTWALLSPRGRDGKEVTELREGFKINMLGEIQIRDSVTARHRYWIIEEINTSGDPYSTYVLQIDEKRFHVHVFGSLKDLFNEDFPLVILG